MAKNDDLHLATGRDFQLAIDTPRQRTLDWQYMRPSGSPQGRDDVVDTDRRQPAKERLTPTMSEVAAAGGA